MRPDVELVQRTLQHTHPEIFGPDPKPLARGIAEQIRARFPSLKHRSVTRFLWNHCRSDDYLRSFSHGHRYNLDGSVSACLTAEEKRYAKRSLAKLEAGENPVSRRKLRAGKRNRQRRKANRGVREARNF